MDFECSEFEMEETVSEEATVISEVIDYSKLSFEERAALLPVPTDDYVVEYAAFCQRMGYTEEALWRSGMQAYYMV